MAMNTHQRHNRFRAPQRISITLSYHVVEALVDRSQLEGRSVGNLSAFLLESAINQREQGQTHGH